MSDPRASITRTVLAPPKPIATVSTMEEVVEEVKLIGKPHGRMRCVNLSLTPEAKAVLYASAKAESTTLGEALMDLVSRAEVPARHRRPDRPVAMRRGVPTVSVFVLLTPGEAQDVVVGAERSGRSVSDYVTSALCR